MLNPYKRLIELLPQYPRLIGTVIAVDGGEVLLEQMNGGTVRAVGDGLTIGDKVFFRNGAVEGPAPDLPEVDIEL